MILLLNLQHHLIGGYCKIADIKLSRLQFEYNGKSMGNYELYLLTGDDVLKEVLEMRQAGMKIREIVHLEFR